MQVAKPYVPTPCWGCKLATAWPELHQYALLLLCRFQWWRDALSSMSASTAPPQHPVLTALWDTLYGGSSSSNAGSSSSSKSSSRASIYQLKRILDAREQDLLVSQPPLRLDDLESYAENTASQLLYLQLAAAGEVLHQPAAVIGWCVCAV
jgi:NADH dehydrogenase [ubiquinone] 1 alpha subcomplex assembly factor 6